MAKPMAVVRAGQFRINVGCGGQHRPGGVPAPLIGLDFDEKLRGDTEFDRDTIISGLGRLTEFLWECMVGLQLEAGQPPMAGDAIRHENYASKLNKFFDMPGSTGFEDLTFVVGVLFPHFDGVSGHVDSMNDRLVGYTRTGALNLSFVLANGTILQLQVRVQYWCTTDWPWL